MCIKQSQYKSDSRYRAQVRTLEWAVVITLATQCEVNLNRNLVKDFRLVVMFTLQPITKA